MGGTSEALRQSGESRDVCARPIREHGLEPPGAESDRITLQPSAGRGERENCASWVGAGSASTQHPRFAGGNGATAFVDAADVGAVAAAALLDPERHRNRAWTPTGSQALTYAEIARILSSTLGRPIRYAKPGLLHYIRHARRTLDMPWAMVAVTSAIYTAARLGKADGLTDDVHQVSGRDPIPFEAFAQEHINAWRR